MGKRKMTYKQSKIKREMNEVSKMISEKQQMTNTSRKILECYNIQSRNAKKEVEEMTKDYWKQEMRKAEKLYERLLQIKKYMEEGLDELAMRDAAQYLAEVINSQNEILGQLAEFPGFIENSGKSDTDFWDFRLDLLFASTSFKDRSRGIPIGISLDMKEVS